MHWKDDSTRKDIAMIEHLDHLYGYAMILTRNKTDAEDLIQETYSRAVEAIGSLRTVTNIKIWLFTVLRNTWFTPWQQPSASAEITLIDAEDNDANLIVESSKNPSAFDMSTMDVERMRQAILQLPVLFGETIMLREYAELSYEEIASVMDCPVGTVMSRLTRARARLQTLFISSPRR